MLELQVRGRTDIHLPINPRARFPRGGGQTPDEEREREEEDCEKIHCCRHMGSHWLQINAIRDLGQTDAI
jgi:hypothetical protein